MKQKKTIKWQGWRFASKEKSIVCGFVLLLMISFKVWDSFDKTNKVDPIVYLAFTLTLTIIMITMSFKVVKK